MEITGFVDITNVKLPVFNDIKVSRSSGEIQNGWALTPFLYFMDGGVELKVTVTIREGDREGLKHVKLVDLYRLNPDLPNLLVKKPADMNNVAILEQSGRVEFVQ